MLLIRKLDQVAVIEYSTEALLEHWQSEHKDTPSVPRAFKLSGGVDSSQWALKIKDPRVQKKKMAASTNRTPITVTNIISKIKLSIFA